MKLEIFIFTFKNENMKGQKITWQNERKIYLLKDVKCRPHRLSARETKRLT